MSEVPVERMLDLELFRFDDEIQIREVLDPRWLDVFCELYRAEGPQALPPVVVFHDGDDVYWVADGHHRIIAAREALSMDGPRALPAKLHEGDKRAAILYAAGANGKHGLPLTSFEKFRAVRRLLDDSEWQQWSDREIARHTGTSHTYVAKIRREVDLNAASSGSDFQIPNTTRTVRRGGTAFRMRTDNIGRRRESQPRSMTLASHRATKDADIDDAREVPMSTGIGALKDAWLAATHTVRHDFLVWVVYRPVTDLGVDPPSADSPSIRTVIVNMGGTADTACTVALPQSRDGRDVELTQEGEA